MHNVECFYNKIEKQQHEIMLNTFSRSLIIWEPAIEFETWAQKMNGGPERPGGEPNSSPTLEIIL